jgi:hypothetical protein
MKKMKTTIAIALAACVSTQVFAQVKEDVIKVALTGQQQISVSTTTGNNVGNWSDGPKYYKTGTTKLTDQNIIKFIGFVLHGNASYYSSKAQLVLVQGELSGFFNITPELGAALPHNHFLDGNNDPAGIDGWFYATDPDSTTDIANSVNSSFVALANGHHLLLNDIGNPYPVGHLQPWGQIYVKDTGKKDFSVANPLCENVTYFFALSVEECYDCFYMNSFISDAKFTTKTTTGQQAGPPCCTVSSSSVLLGAGKDRYYLTMSFDNTLNNPYLNSLSDSYVGVDGVKSTAIQGDGINPDQIPFNDLINFRQGQYLPFEARFTLNGILTYTWNLKFVNTADISPDFVGIGSYAASGYGFVGLYCELFTGTATFTEKVVKTACCVDSGWDVNSYGNDGWYGPGAEYVAVENAPAGFDSVYGNGGYASPMNVGASLTYHHNFNQTYPYLQTVLESGWPTPAIIVPLGL